MIQTWSRVWPFLTHWTSYRDWDPHPDRKTGVETSWDLYHRLPNSWCILTYWCVDLCYIIDQVISIFCQIMSRLLSLDTRYWGFTPILYQTFTWNWLVDRPETPRKQGLKQLQLEQQKLHTRRAAGSWNSWKFSQQIGVRSMAEQYIIMRIQLWCHNMSNRMERSWTLQLNLWWVLIIHMMLVGGHGDYDGNDLPGSMS